MNLLLITWKNACFVLLSICLVTACKEEKKEKDITETVQTTAGIIDKNITAELKEDGVVILKGEVADEVTKTAAINAVKHVEGVKKIESYLTVKVKNDTHQQMSGQDLRLKASIDSLLAINNISGVDIAVSEGEVTLSGQVTRSQEVAIMKIAGEAHPGRLKNTLTVNDKEN